MIVKPFQKTPRVPRIALVNDDGKYVDESGATFSHSVEYKFKRGEIVCFILWDTAISLSKRAIGEFFRWNTQETRWRYEKHPEEDYWKPRPLDAGFINFPVTVTTRFEEVLKQIVEFRDWLADEGAKPHCSFGSTSLSLLKAKIQRNIFTGIGACPPIEFTRGGRQLIGLGGMGSYEGKISNWDLPAAYAATLGNLRYNGTWAIRPYNSAIKAYELGAPVYCHATVDIPDIPFGPLPSTIHRASNPIEAAINNKFGYITNGRMEGIWTLSELLAAEEVGCKFTPLSSWAMLSTEQPFIEWWNAILRGRELEGRIARFLAKKTGNALWGMFCTDSSARAKKVIVNYDENGKKTTRRINFRPNYQKPGHDLAEAVSGAVRAKLYQHIVVANDHLLSAHTDGVWVQGNYTVPEGWRIKKQARKIDLIDAQTLRYYTDSQHSHVVMSGIPPKIAPDHFAKRWEECEKYLADPNYLSELREESRSKRRVFRITAPNYIPK